MAKASSNGDGEAEFLLDVLFDHKMDWVKQLLKEKGLPTGGNKPDLRSRVETGLQNSTLQTADLVELLDRVEGWGNQHIYLYKASKALLKVLSDEHKLKKKLRTLKLIGLFNARVPLVLPDTPTLSVIEWSDEQVRFIWIEKRAYREPRDDESYVDGTLEFDAYQVKHSRGLISFSCDLVTGLAELMIQRLPSGNNYAAERQKYLDELSSIFDVTQLSPQKISGAILKVDQIKTIRKRSSQLTTRLGNGATYTSRSRKEDVYKDPGIKRARKALGSGVAGRLGNYYWPLLDRDVHIKLYAKDQRIGVFGECTEDEVTNVLSEVRGHC